MSKSQSVPSAALKRWLDGTHSCVGEIQIGKRVQVLIGCFRRNIDPVFLFENSYAPLDELLAEPVLHEHMLFQLCYRIVRVRLR